MPAAADDRTAGPMKPAGHASARQDTPAGGPVLTPAAEAARQKRLADEAEALRANLRRRKAQARARSGLATSAASDAGTSRPTASPHPETN